MCSASWQRVALVCFTQGKVSVCDPCCTLGALEIQVFQEQVSSSPVSSTGPSPYWSVSLYLTLACQILKSFWLPKCGCSGEVGVGLREFIRLEGFTLWCWVSHTSAVLKQYLSNFLIPSGAVCDSPVLTNPPRTQPSLLSSSEHLIQSHPSWSSFCLLLRDWW